MKYLKILLALSLLFMMSCAVPDSKENSTQGTRVEKKSMSYYQLSTIDNSGVKEVDIDSTDGEITKIHLSGIDNLILQSSSVDYSTMISGSEVDIEDYDELTINKFHKIKGGTKYKTFFEFLDSSGDEKRYIVDASGDPLKINFNPRKSSKVANAEYLQEIGGKIYYLNDYKKIMALEVDASTDTKIAENVDQFTINDAEEILMQTTDGVFFRKTGGNLAEIKGLKQDFERGWNWSIIAESDNTFFNNENGFIFKQTDGGGTKLLFRVFTQDNEVVYNYAQSETYYQKYELGINGVHQNLNLNSIRPSDCNYAKLVGGDFVFCGNQKLYLGEKGIDARKIFYFGNPVRHCQEDYQITLSENYIYEYSKCGSGDFISYKLTWNDPFEEVELDALHLITDEYIINADTLESTIDNTLNFCGSKDGVDVIVRIENADRIPDFFETNGTCDQLISI